MSIVILDDEPDRITEMTRCLALQFPNHQLIVFDNAPDMIKWLSENLGNAELISLDHDLGPNRRRNAEVFDPGTGRDVANYLAAQKPQCPVIVHTTNSLAAPGMRMQLDEAGWENDALMPYNDLEWIGTAWMEKVQRLLRKK